jgi:hypothetical protein
LNPTAKAASVPGPKTPPHFLDSTYAELGKSDPEFSARSFRLNQVCDWVFSRRAESFEEMTSLPAALAERLQGETEDELEADAKALLAALPKAAAPNINGQGGAQPPANGWDETERKRLASIYGVSAKHFGAQ